MENCFQQYLSFFSSVLVSGELSHEYVVLSQILINQPVIVWDKVISIFFIQHLIQATMSRTWRVKWGQPAILTLNIPLSILDPTRWKNLQTLPCPSRRKYKLILPCTQTPLQKKKKTKSEIYPVASYRKSPFETLLCLWKPPQISSKPKSSLKKWDPGRNKCFLSMKGVLKSFVVSFIVMNMSFQ